MCSSVVWSLVPASIDICIRSCGEYIVPTPLDAVLMAGWVSWQGAFCLRMHWLLRVLHSPAICVQESGSPHSGHASMGANLYLYANLPLYS
jgi:hypothetical protein